MPTFVFRMFREFAQTGNCRLLAIVRRAHNWSCPSGSNINTSNNRWIAYVTRICT